MLRRVHNYSFRLFHFDSRKARNWSFDYSIFLILFWKVKRNFVSGFPVYEFTSIYLKLIWNYFHLNRSFQGPLREAPNLIVTPHVAFFSHQSSKEMREMAAQEVRRGLLNKMPNSLRNCINKHTLPSATATASQNAGSSLSAAASMPIPDRVLTSNKSSYDSRSNPSPALSTSSANAIGSQQQQLLAHLSCKFLKQNHAYFN